MEFYCIVDYEVSCKSSLRTQGINQMSFETSCLEREGNLIFSTQNYQREYSSLSPRMVRPGAPERADGSESRLIPFHSLEAENVISTAPRSSEKKSLNTKTLTFKQIKLRIRSTAPEQLLPHLDEGLEESSGGWR